MEYSKRLLENLENDEEPEVIDCYKDLQKHSELKTYSVYLIGGQTVRLKAYGYRYEVQIFSSLSGEWLKDKTVGQISFYVPYVNKKGEKGKSKSYDYHYFKFDDVSAIVCEGL